MKTTWPSIALNALFNIVFWILLFMFILAVRYYDIGNIAFVQQDIHIPLVRIYGNGTVDPGKTHFGKYIFSATVQFLFVGAFLGNVVFGVFTTLQPEIGEQIFYKLLVDRYRPAQEENRAFFVFDKQL